VVSRSGLGKILVEDSGSSEDMVDHCTEWSFRMLHTNELALKFHTN